MFEFTSPRTLFVAPDGSLPASKLAAGSPRRLGPDAPDCQRYVCEVNANCSVDCSTGAHDGGEHQRRGLDIRRGEHLAGRSGPGPPRCRVHQERRCVPLVTFGKRCCAEHRMPGEATWVGPLLVWAKKVFCTWFSKCSSAPTSRSKRRGPPLPQRRRPHRAPGDYVAPDAQDSAGPEPPHRRGRRARRRCGRRRRCRAARAAGAAHPACAHGGREIRHRQEPHLFQLLPRRQHAP